MSASVLSVSSRALLEACRRLRIDTDPLLAAARVDRAAVDDPDGRLPVEQVRALWKKAYEVSGDPNLALHAVEALPWGAYRVLDFLAGNAPTVGAALTKVSDYFPLINPLIRLPVAAGAREATLDVEAPTDPDIVTRPYAEYVLAAIYLRTGVPTRYPLARVEFTHAAPPDVSEHERIFGCPVRFSAAATRLVVARDVWDAARPAGDTTLFGILDSHARILLERMSSDQGFLGRVREAIGAELRGGEPTLATVARRLSLSARTLQRRLKDEGRGTAFADLLDEMRYATARAYLAQRDVASSEVAYLLGFGNASSFHRAFRRWSGTTPAEFRRTAR